MNIKTDQKYVALITALISSVSCVFDDYKVLLSSDSPAVLDAPITFFGELQGDDISDDTKLRWRWFDNTSPSHWKEIESNGSTTKMNYTITYPSSDYYSSEYEMTLVIFKYTIFMFWENLGETRIKFSLTKELNGQLIVSQNNLVTQTIVSNNSLTSIDVQFHDPEHFLDKAVSIHYYWFINAVNYGQTAAGHFEYNFIEPGDYIVEVTIIVDFDNTTLKKDQPNVAYDTDKDALALRYDSEKPNASVKMAIFQKKVVSKAPIGNMTVGGDTLLKHGQLVDLNIDCTGSSPWLYCWEIKEKGYNITGNETCSESKPSLLKNDCEFPILWYFRNSDTYNLLVIITNDVSSHIEVIPISIVNVAPQAPVSIVIIPVISSIIVVVIIVTGVALHAHYRNRLAVEVADFDFGQNNDEEELQYKSFWERLRESFGAHFTNNSLSDAQSEGSSVSGRRSVQIPGPSGIGYGSIT